jgi:hypothetical protein
VITDTTPIIAWVAYPGADRYAVRIGSRPTEFPTDASYQVTRPLDARRKTVVFVYAYTRDRPDGFVIGTAALWPNTTR